MSLTIEEIDVCNDRGRRGRPDQNKHCGSRHPFVSTAQRKCQTFAVPMVVAIKEQGIVS